jgi:hypothetical protein
MNEKGQVTIFIIIALIVIALGILIYIYFPKVQTTLVISSENPATFIQECMEDEVEEIIGTISLQGGKLNPENSYLYENNKIDYLCYTNEDYIPCVVQQPMLKQSIENEIKNSIENQERSCFDLLKENFENKGYTVSLREGKTTVELLPKEISIIFEKRLVLTKGDTETYDKLGVSIKNNLYELVSISNSILSMEIKYGDAETTIYMDYYHDLKVEKKKQTNGTTIYIITNRNTGNKFQFASRSVAWPPGI